MSKEEILKLWLEYEGRGADAVVLFAQVIQYAETARCADLCYAARPVGGRQWSKARCAVYDALTHVAQSICVA
jgi:hypothetical protein